MSDYYSYENTILMAASRARGDKLSRLYAICESQKTISTLKLSREIDLVLEDEKLDAIYLKYIADKMAKLQAENAELKKRSEWISVEDELPEVCGDRSDGVLVLRDLGEGTVSSVCVSFLWSNAMQMHLSHKAPFEITDCWNKQESKGYRVTHWMPLPKRPKGE